MLITKNIGAPIALGNKGGFSNALANGDENTRQLGGDLRVKFQNFFNCLAVEADVRKRREAADWQLDEIRFKQRNNPEALIRNSARLTRDRKEKGTPPLLPMGEAVGGCRLRRGCGLYSDGQ